MVRQEGRYEDQPGHLETIPIALATEDLLIKADQVLTGSNKARVGVNQEFRKWVHLDTPFPTAGERVVCLRNNHEAELYNGGVYVVAEDAALRAPAQLRLTVQGPNGVAKLMVDPGPFQGIAPDFKRDCDLFDFGYALTVHKAQGSEWNTVVLIDDWRDARTRRAWLYTALTRAKQRVTIIKP